MKIMDSSTDLFVRCAKRGLGNKSRHSPLGNGHFIPQNGYVWIPGYTKSPKEYVWILGNGHECCIP